MTKYKCSTCACELGTDMAFARCGTCRKPSCPPHSAECEEKHQEAFQDVLAVLQLRASEACLSSVAEAKTLLGLYEALHSRQDDLLDWNDFTFTVA